MKKNTKYMLGAAGLIAAYILWKKRSAAQPAAQVTAPVSAAITAAPETSLSGTTFDGHVLQSIGGRGIFG